VAVLNIPAQADHDPNKGETDPLGREPGEFMLSARGRTTQSSGKRSRPASAPAPGTRSTKAGPSPAEGGMFKRDHWREYDVPLWLVRDDGSHWVTHATRSSRPGT
jgi:hypothetical protein